MALKLTTPFTQIQDSDRTAAGSYAVLNNLQFNGDISRKLFTIESSVGSPPFTILLTLSQGGTGNAFNLFPGTIGGTSSITLDGGTKTSFIVDYDSSKGSGLTASIECDTNIEGEFDADIVLGPAAPIYFSVFNPEKDTTREIGPLLSIGSDEEYIIQQASSKITQDETSFGVIRTNPKLTGNVKITVDSSENIWLNSIDADKELADDRFKKYRISPDSSYTIDINRFFDYGQTPAEIVYSLYQADSNYTTTKRSFDKQYDRFYQYGAEQLASKFYTEDFSFFAPLYLKKEIPEYFVLFRSNGPVNKFTYETPFEDWKNYVTSAILKNSQIIKVYDLTTNSSIGQYLKNIVDHPSRRESEMTVSYQQNGYTTFNGINYNKGTYTQSGELLYDYINEENPLSNIEEFVTLGFQRNKVISSHLINLEFLFNDDDVDNYSINRYFGFYVNSIDLANFTLSAEALADFSYDVGQTPFPRKGIDGTKVSQKSFVQTNPDGIKIYVDTESVESVPTITKNAFSSTVTDISVGATAFDVTFPGKFDDKLIVGETVSFFTTSLEATAELASFVYDGKKTVLTFNSSTFTSTITLTFFSGINYWKADFYTLEKYKLYEQKVFDNSFIEDQPRLFYVKDNDGYLSSVTHTEIKYVNIDPFTQKKVIEVSLKDTKVDIGNYSGFTNLLTQTEAKLLNKGRSSLSVNVNNYFSPNDYLEIRWEPGPTSVGYPLRWKVVANNTILAPGDSWPSYVLTSDSEGEYYLAYFNSGDSSVNLSTFVESIQEAFNQFPFKDFEVLAKGTNLHFRSTQEGKFSESAKLIYSNTNINTINVMGIPGGITGNVNFIGASNRNKTRARISKQVAEGMLLKEYVSTKGSFTHTREFNILNSTIVFAPYLDEPVYDEDTEKLIDFKNSDDYRVICLENETSEIQLTSDGKMTTYELFKPSLGVLSILPIKDFDTDFYSSDYTKSYIPELIRYFAREYTSANIIGITGGGTSPYIYTLDQEFEFDSYPQYLPFLKLSQDGLEDPILYNTNAQLVFNAAGATATLEIAVNNIVYPQIGEQILFMPGEKHLYFTEDFLSKFKGFLTLSGIVSVEDELIFQSFENLWDPTRFELELNSEYERMGENYLKSLVLNSRVVPYSMKWVSPQGRDVRDNPYRFNYHRVFGNMNFTPSEILQAPDPIFFTHEWPYLDSVPLKFPTLEYPESTFSYFFEELNDTYDFSSLKRDWFSQYFSTGFPIEKAKDGNNVYQSVKTDPLEKYSYFNYENFSNQTFTFFRGYRLHIDEIDQVTGEPISTQKYNNYKFSVIIKSEEENPQINQDPIEFKTIVNEKWKFITIVITVRVSSYRFPKGHIGYVDLYTMQNSNDYAYYSYVTSSGYTLPGYYSTVPSDKKISYPINLENNSLDPSLSVVYNYYDSYPSNDNFVDNLVNQVLPLSTGNYSNIIAYYENFSFQASVCMDKPVSIYDLDTMQLSSNLAYSKLSPVDLAFTISLPYSSIPWQDYVFYHQTGGDNSLKDITERLSFAEIKKVIQGTSERGTMAYQIYKEDGTVLNTPNFIMTTISPEALTRIFDFVPISDPDKPAQFHNIENIGIVLSEQKDLQTIYRYQGDFSPKFKDILKFWLREDENFTNASNRDYLFNNTHFAEELKNYSILNNQFYNKVSDTEILTLSPDSGFSPVYPLIDEISIDKKTIFAWNSSWDQNYYRKYTSTSDYAEVRGTEEMKEVKSFFGSKIMKVPQQFDLYQFKLTQYASIEDLNASDAEFGYVENVDSVTIQVNCYDKLLREMLGTSSESRAKTEFLKVISQIPSAFEATTIVDKTVSYLEDNIINLYQVSDIKLFLLQTGNSADDKIATAEDVQNIPDRPVVEFTSTTSGEQTLSENELIAKKYFSRKDAKVIKLSNLKFQIIYPLDSRFYTSLSVGVAIERI